MQHLRENKLSNVYPNFKHRLCKSCDGLIVSQKSCVGAGLGWVVDIGTMSLGFFSGYNFSRKKNSL